uniref:mechanosensitive ion channel n=1 Tax=Bacillus sp. HMF5848 TaxID=2495421 RepID=UPI0021AE301B|nr:mechanosensitive ion channel [Bacillus sp. HMF5848]
MRDIDSIVQSFMSYLGNLPDLLFALIVLFIGWLIAKGIGSGVTKLLKKFQLHNKLFDGNEERKETAEKAVGKTVYYILMVFVFILFFNILNLSIIAAPLVEMLSSITTAIPSVLKAALVLLLGWVIATVFSWLIEKGARLFKLKERFVQWGVVRSEEEAEKAVKSTSKVVFYLILLIFIPGVLSALNITGVSEPFAGMIGSLLAFLPKLFAATLIVLIGWVIARIVRDIIKNLLANVGVDRLSNKFGLSKILDGTSLSSIIGTIVYVLILIPVVIAALERLNINGISDPAVNMLNEFLTMLPNIIVAIVLVLVGLWLGKWTSNIVSNLLENMGVNSLLSRMGLGKLDSENSNTTLSKIIGQIAQVVIALLFIIEALEVVELSFIVTLATGVFAYLPYLFTALIILGVGFYLGNLVQKMLQRVLQGHELYKVLGYIAKYTIITLSFFMALDQLGVAASIVNAAFVLVLGGLALAFGLSFGLGGKELASKYLSKWTSKLSDSEENTNL